MWRLVYIKLVENFILTRLVLWAFLFFVPLICIAQEQLQGQWYEVDSRWHFQDPPVNEINKPSLTGGNYIFLSTLNIIDAKEPLVIDFKNASVLGLFHHYITDATGRLVAEAQGGIESKTKNTFFMRHGREFKLSPGKYQLITHLVSIYFIAEPQPYWDTLSNYRQAIKWGNLIASVCLGVLISLGVYYAILAYVRRRISETMYTCFIWLNVIFTGTSMLITPDLFGIHWFYLASVPILFSNFAYLLFAKNLLQIRAHTHPRLHLLAKLILVVLALLLLVALLNKNLVLECARYGVGMMMMFGLLAALVRAYEGYKVAYFYLVAIGAFFLIGSVAISSQDLEGIYTIYVEHIGLVAVTAEVLLIGLVLGYQFASVYREKEQHLALVEHSLQIAHHDSLTGLPNRYALDIALEKMPKAGMLTLLDMDNLKLYNDEYGHQRGDEMLKMFSDVMSAKLGNCGVLHRMGGDEFAVTSDSVHYTESIKHAITETIDFMCQNGFEKAGISYGSAKMTESSSIVELKELADERMYRHKRSTRAN
jgi:diguanylate cyclase (GGDEF)-like protein